MKEEMLKRFIALVQKTGDKVIITDLAGDSPYVLMSLDQYERLASGTPAAAVQPATPVAEEKPKTAKAEAKGPAANAFNAPIQSAAPAVEPEKASQVKRSAALWRSMIERESAAEMPAREIFRSPAKPEPPATRSRRPAPQYDGAGLEPEGEEQFYLEPLE